MSTRIAAIDPEQAQGQAKQLLAGVKAKLGITPNMMRTMAQSPAVLEGYLSLAGALSKGKLGGKLGEQLALAVGQANDCGYCVAAHTALGKHAGLTPDQLLNARRATAEDAKVQAALTLARQIVDSRGKVTDAQLAAARAAGLGEGDVAEVVAHVALNVLTNYFNNVAGTEIDFPAPPALV